MVLTALAAEVAHSLLQEGSDVSEEPSQAPEVVVASRAMQQVSEVNELPQPSMGSHNAEQFPELDSQAIPEDMREEITDVIEAGRVSAHCYAHSLVPLIFFHAWSCLVIRFFFSDVLHTRSFHSSWSPLGHAHLVRPRGRKSGERERGREGERERERGG